MCPLKLQIFSPLSLILLWLAETTTPITFDGEMWFRSDTNAPTLYAICIFQTIRTPGSQLYPETRLFHIEPSWGEHYICSWAIGCCYWLPLDIEYVLLIYESIKQKRALGFFILILFWSWAAEVERLFTLQQLVIVFLANLDGYDCRFILCLFIHFGLRWVEILLLFMFVDKFWTRSGLWFQ